MQLTGTFNGAARELQALLQKHHGAAPADYRHLRIAALPASGSALAYCEFGDPMGTPMLCLHGLGLSGLYFEQYDDYFTELGIRAIAPCLMGGIYRPDPAATIDTLATELVELLDVLGIGRFDVMAFSWGTLAQLALLAKVPGRIRKAGVVGAMTPLAFLDPRLVGKLKADVRMSLRMVGRAPFLHRGLMALVCQLPINALIDQFKDEHLSQEESAALETGTAFHAWMARCMSECLRTGSQFFTSAWRMFLDRPGYALADLASARGVDLRLYAASIDNVHLPQFSSMVAAAISGEAVEEVNLRICHARARFGSQPEGGFLHVYGQRGCSIWMLEGAGRMACALNFRDALANLMTPEQARISA